jgi:hypothetical protein
VVAGATGPPIDVAPYLIPHIIFSPNLGFVQPGAGS